MEKSPEWPYLSGYSICYPIHEKDFSRKPKDYLEKRIRVPIMGYSWSFLLGFKIPDEDFKSCHGGKYISSGASGPE